MISEALNYDTVLRLFASFFLKSFYLLYFETRPAVTSEAFDYSMFICSSSSSEKSLFSYLLSEPACTVISAAFDYGTVCAASQAILEKQEKWGASRPTWPYTR